MTLDIKKIEKIANWADTNFQINPNYRNFWVEKYFGFLKWEIEEVEAELRLNNKVYLEDELWDILWVYLNLLNKLEDAEYIDKNRIFDRCFNKFHERISPYLKSDWKNCSMWNEIKAKQKVRLKEEHDNLYGNA